jgi:hypothetical protein
LPSFPFSFLLKKEGGRGMKYEDLNFADVCLGAADAIRKGGAEIKGNKIVFTFAETGIDLPWIFHKYSKERDCVRWHNIYFQLYGILPKECMHCWKVVARPKNLDQLFELDKLQARMVAEGGLACKCGVDVRATETYKGIHLGFWYCPMNDLEGAKKHWRQIRERIRGALSLDTTVILKRGCTEMENEFGPSHLWKYTKENRMKEALLDSTIVLDQIRKPQPTLVRTHIYAIWINYAHRMGDPTAKKYYRNYPESTGSIPTTTYHDGHPEIVEEKVDYVETINIQRLQDN